MAKKPLYELTPTQLLEEYDRVCDYANGLFMEFFELDEMKTSSQCARLAMAITDYRLSTTIIANRITCMIDDEEYEEMVMNSCIKQLQQK